MSADKFYIIGTDDKNYFVKLLSDFRGVLFCNYPTESRFFDTFKSCFYFWKKCRKSLESSHRYRLFIYELLYLEDGHVKISCVHKGV